MVYIKNFASWGPFKSHLNNREPLFCKERQIWWCSTGVNVGSEQDGKNARFERPVLIVRRFTARLFLAMPLTTNMTEKPHKIIAPAWVNNKKTRLNRAFLINQMRVLDAARIHRKMGYVDKATFDEIKRQICASLHHEL